MEPDRPSDALGDAVDSGSSGAHDLDEHAPIDDVIGEITASLIGLSEMLLDEIGMDQAVANVLQVALESLGDVSGVSLTISQPGVPGRQFVTRGATVDWAEELDEWQYDNGTGPCLTADETASVVVIQDCRTDERFPAFGEIATSLGVSSWAAFPMTVRGRSLGSLNASYAASDGVPSWAVEAGERLASATAPLLSNWLAHARVISLTEELEDALAGRSIVERAKGLLMGELGVDQEQALEVLRTRCQREGLELRDVAARLLEDHDRT